MDLLRAEPPRVHERPDARTRHPHAAAETARARTVNPDFLDLLAALVRADARFLIAGAHAMAAHGVPRATGDLDVWIQPDPENAGRVWAALLEFGAPITALGLSEADLAAPDMVFQLGIPPRRIDILTSITGVRFEQAWPERRVYRIEELDLPFLGRSALLDNKRATGRAKDRADVETLEQQEDAEP